MFTINDEEQRQEQVQTVEESMTYPDERMVSFDYANISNRFDSDERRLTRMVSNSMNTIEIMPNYNLEDVLGGGAIIAENPMQFAAALFMQYRIQGTLEPLNVIPGLFYNQHEQSYQSETYLDDRMNDSSVNGSSTAYGSEVSSFTDTEELERRDQATGQDDELQVLIYDPRISMILRKPLYRQDDEPSIY
ncbi:uncharacterized protein LOC118450465 [Vespa mandarinia]|uniref:uncharacterized protein LOC118450465 n=1 Tax=Vespa mandarinia TaxID=7446 RepID=UPI00160F3DAD|nr:uncharacterized protein LOC118450465 [Vespa mandarinia]